ncbi:MAG: creatininase family protein [Chloroflexi bacterium]|nr:creatininase family protein [Chloroflexota bacterium]MCL5075999.1 creatininase family protein [Chloroflexota bacterium]
MRKHLYAQMTWEEVNEAVREGRVVVIPVAAIEQHGPHLPIDMDNLATLSVCEKAAKRSPGVLICAPPIHYGFNEHNMDFPGTITVKPENFINYLFDVGESFARQGFERIIWVNGHGSNSPLCQVVARRVTNETSALSAAVNYFDLFREVGEKIRESKLGGVAHACEFETSLYMYLCPELVKRDKIKDEPAPDQSPWIVHDLLGWGPVHFMPFWSQRSRWGVEGMPTLATAEKGKTLFEAAVDNLIAFAKYFKDMDLTPRQRHIIKRNRG